MRDGWVVTTLGKVADVQMGLQLSPARSAGPRQRAYLRAGNIVNTSIALDDVKTMEFTVAEEEKYRIARGDVLLVEGGNNKSLGMPAQVADEHEGLCIQNTLIRLRTKDAHSACSGYLYLAALSLFESKVFSRLGKGTTILHLGGTRVPRVSIPVPPISEQRRIVDLMRAVDEYVAAADKRAETAKAARGALLADLLANPGDDWVETRLGAHVILSTGKLDVNAGVEGGQYPFFTCARNPYWIDVAAFSGASVLVAGNGDLNVKYYDGQFNAYQRTYVLQPRSMNTLNARFLFLFMCVYVDTLRSHTQGSTIQYLKKSQFTEAPINLPPIAEQKRIVDLMRVVDDEVTTATKLAESSRHARSALLSDLLSGNHEIPTSYDRFLEAA